MSTCSITICRARRGRYLALAVDAVTDRLLRLCRWLLWRYVGDRRARAHGHHRPAAQRSFFYPVFAGFVLMLLRSIQVLVGNYRRGYSVLERPGAFDAPGA